MNYIELGRTLDRLAQETGDYQYCPDDILTNILDYTGVISRKPTYMYKVQVKFMYDRYTKVSNDSTDFDLEDITSLYHHKYKLITKDKVGWCSFDYCGCCDRFYASPKGHMTTDKHINNHKKGDKCCDIKQCAEIKCRHRYRNGFWTQNIRIQDIVIRDWWC